MEIGRILGLHRPSPLPAGVMLLLVYNAILLAWRVAMRFAFVTGAYGPVEGLLSIPRVVVSNAISIMAARRALQRYLHIRRTGRIEWGKTSHAFPASVPAE